MLSLGIFLDHVDLLEEEEDDEVSMLVNRLVEVPSIVLGKGSIG